MPPPVHRERTEADYMSVAAFSAGEHLAHVLANDRHGYAGLVLACGSIEAFAAKLFVDKALRDAFTLGFRHHGS